MAPQEPVAAEGNRIRILICDDHRILTDAMVSVIEGDGSFELVAPPVHEPSEAVEACGRLRPDVVLMDVAFEGEMTGIDATREIGVASPESKVVIVTTHRDDRLLVEAVEAGAAAYLSKTAGADQVLTAARAVAAGEILFDPKKLSVVIARVARKRQEDRALTRSLDELTDQERRVLRLMIAGDSNDEIAASLSVSPATAQAHVRAIVRKLGARSRAHAVAMGIALGPGLGAD